MNRIGKKEPVWEREDPRLRYPRLNQDQAFDVAVIGAGITGLTTALRLKQAGKKVAVLDLGTVAGGASGHTSAHLTACLDLPFGTLVSKVGEEKARLAVRSNLEAIGQIEEIVARHRIDCDFQRVPGFRYTESPEETAGLEEEAALAARLGLRAAFTRDVPLPFATQGAVRLEDQAEFHPLKYLRALAERVDGDGCAVYEKSRVEEIEDGQPCRLRLRNATVRADAVVHATHTPINLVLSIHTRVAPYMTYMLAIRSRQAMPAALFWDTADPYHYLRRMEDDQGPIILVGGMDHKAGQEQDTPARFRALLEYAMERFSVVEVANSWSYEVLEPVDGLPYIGRKPGSDRVFLATGFSGTGLTYGTLAGGLLSDLILGRSHPCEELFSPSRVKPLAGAKEFFKENLNFAWRLVADRVRAGEAIENLPTRPGEGAIVEVEGRKAAVYRDEEMQVHVLSPVCPHAGCIVGWNAAQKTWDCPCHGARYAPTGEVLCGPATRDLQSAPPGRRARGKKVRAARPTS